MTSSTLSRGIELKVNMPDYFRLIRNNIGGSIGHRKQEVRDIGLRINVNGKTKALEKNCLIVEMYLPIPYLTLADGTMPAYWSAASTPTCVVLYTGAGGCDGRVGIGRSDPLGGVYRKAKHFIMCLLIILGWQLEIC